MHNGRGYLNFVAIAVALSLVLVSAAMGQAQPASNGVNGGNFFPHA